MKIQILANATLAASALALTAIAAPAAKAGCGDAKGLIQICYKTSCEVQRMVRHCSSVSSGNHWISDKGYRLGYSFPIGNKYTFLEVVYERWNKTLYSGDPAKSPYTFAICAENPQIGDPCSGKSWAKGYE